MTDYTKQAEDFLKANGLEFRAVLVGSDCPPFCKDAEAEKDLDLVDTFPRKTHIHGKHYRCTFSGAGRGHVAFDFWNSYADEEYNALGTRAHRFTMHPYDRTVKRKPTAYDVLACLPKSDPGTFEDFCGDFGYDNDSRKAESVYRAVVKEWRKVERFFKPAEMPALQEIA